MKFRSNFNNGFINRSCLHCAILKACKERDVKYFFQNVRNEIFKILKMFKYNMKFTRTACWIDSKINNWDKNITIMIFLFCYYCWSLLWCNYWKSLMLWSSTSWSRLKLTVQIQFALYPWNSFWTYNRNMTDNSVKK